MDAIESSFWRRLIHVAGWVGGKNGAQGAHTAVYCALTDEDVGGKYYSDCREETRFVSSALGDVNVENMLYQKTLDQLMLPKTCIN